MAGVMTLSDGGGAHAPGGRASSPLARAEHEQVVVINEPRSGLRAIIAVHSTALGPAVGGLRLRPYADLDAALLDALRLSEAMTLKNAAAGLDLGGGKAVIADDGDSARRTQRLLAFADALNELGGRFITAEDIGTTTEDMDLIATRSDRVLGRSAERGGGDPSVVTARTVLGAIAEGARACFGSPDLDGLRVAIVGAGKVGGRVAVALARRGARVLVADAVADRAWRVAAEQDGIDAIAVGDALTADVDVLAPCAGGEVIDAGLAGALRCRLVAGAANNPLVDDDAARALAARDILFIPDFLANCGGMIAVAAQLPGAPVAVEEAVIAAIERLRDVLDEAHRTDRLPHELARERALARVARAAGEAVRAR
jgi:glutamate dehydrogenase/leucine dehydrogenase